MDLDAPISDVNVFGFMIALWIIGAAFVLYKAMKTKNSVYYMGSGFCGAMAFAFLVGALGQALLCLILMGVSTLVFYIVVMPKLKRIMPEEVAKAAKTVDTSGPIRFRDLFNVSFMVKLERKYGEHKAMVIWSVAGVAVTSPLIAVLVLLRVITWPIGVGALGFGFILGLTLYRRMRKGL
ncbi:MAG: hypothetical protein LBH79_02580 [Nitrososphaerota archaeon]|jgi:hypothetical protein|nr:hypothetical protein [Nitrososphaerota archaeon]